MNALAHAAFEHIRSQTIDSLNLEVEEYRHLKTGAQHIHISADNPENVFLVALRTVPEDSRGVAHILEHTALCGSKKYPVRDPFFMMIRRSLNTFMNAFTSSDWTAYPFASKNRKDFSNLLDVYLDAVFFSRLDELDFAQEGHRLEFAEADNPESALVYKGVVFNEMKGAMSSVSSTLWHTLCKYLYPTNTYHFNSGGDPECIPNLSYEQLVQFYQSHYHPSNAVFMTYGDIPAKEHQVKFEEQALNQFEALDHQISVPDEKRYLAPIAVDEHYALDEEDSSAKTHIVMSWLLGNATDLKANMEAHLLNSVLLDNSASPLLKALETSDLGTSPSPLCGLDDSHKEMLFVCGLEGSEPDRAEAVEQLILGVFSDIAENGVPQAQVEASLHQLELKQREVGGDGYPYGLQLILTGLTNATHRGDPVALLNLEPVLAQLREDIADPEFIKQLARRIILDNSHRVRLTLRPDTELSQRRQQAEAKQLAEIKASLSTEDQQHIVERAATLTQRQTQEDDEGLLPKVGLEDVSPEMDYVAAANHLSSPMPLTSYSAGTNGIVYQQLIIALPQLSETLTDLVPLYTTCLTELGVGKRDYLATQMWQAAISGGFSAYASVRSQPDDVQTLNGHLVLSAKGLATNQAELTALMTETLSDVRFDELSRIRELVAQIRARSEASVTGNGHSLAMSAAAAKLSPGAEMGHRWGGLYAIKAIKTLDSALNDTAALETLSQQLQEIHQLVLQGQRQFLLVAEADKLADFEQGASGQLSTNSSEGFTPFQRPSLCEPANQLWTTSTQVNFCARAYPTVPMEHPDAPALNVLGGFLRNGYLHTAIREQGGAYGGGAGQDNNSGAFRFYSYRDPRLEETLADFDQSLQWLASPPSGQHEWQQVEEAILGVISSIDKPGSPAGEAKQTFHAELSGRSRKKREQFRNRVLAVTLDDLLRVASTYLTPDKSSTAIITSADRAAELGDLALSNLETHVL
ncbi:MAG: insulinase family protein [Porticoccaceae bacterium]|nr:insulinase family protein [Porticoccaceae bacterium]